MSGAPLATTPHGNGQGGDGGREPFPPPLAARARRVLGVFFVMLGTSALIDGHALWLGGPLALAGGALFAWGSLEPTAAPALADEAADHAP